MTKGRTNRKYARVYIGGYDLSCYTRSIGPLSMSAAEGADDPLCQSVVGAWLGQTTISPGTLNGIFDNTATSGIHALLSTPGVSRNIMVALGIQAVPAQGDPVYMCVARQQNYIAAPSETPSAVSLQFGPTGNDSTSLAYDQPWGVLLHANSAVTAANSAVGVDLDDIGMGTSDTSTDGGWMMYQVTAGAPAGGLANIKVQHSATNVDGDFVDLVATGDIDVGTAPTSGIVALATTADVYQYVRWQVALNTATSVTFALGFVRGRKR